MEMDKVVFGQTLKKSRGRISLAKLAGMMGCSASKIHKMETGNASEKVDVHFIQRICDSLNLSPSARTALFASAGITTADERNLQSLVEGINATLAAPDVDQDSDDLLAYLHNSLGVWRERNRAKRRKIVQAIIPASGWQSPLLPPEFFERSMIPALMELNRALIEDVIFVVTPGTREFAKLKKLFPELSITFAVQSEPRGLGSALLTALGRLHDDPAPVAVLLPDEIDNTFNTLSKMIGIYGREHKTLIAVEQLDRPHGVDVHSHVTTLGQQLSASSRLYFPGSDFGDLPPAAENQKVVRLAGRFILAPETVEALVSISGPNFGSTRHDVDRALNRIWKESRAVQLYHLPTQLRSIAPH